jgi:hypothetical protein
MLSRGRGSLFVLGYFRYHFPFPLHPRKQGESNKARTTRTIPKEIGRVKKILTLPNLLLPL